MLEKQHKSALLGERRSRPGECGRMSTRSFGRPDHAPQQRHLAKEFLARLRRAAQQHRPRGHIRNDARLGADLRALADMQVARHRRLATDLDEILQHRRAGDADLRNDDTATSQPYIMSNLHEVIEPRSRTDDGVARRSRSIVVLAPTSTSSPMTTRPSWGMLRKPVSVTAKLKPS